MVSDMIRYVGRSLSRHRLPPHRPSHGWERSEKALHFHSLGNLIFDQTAALNTGVLVELRFLEQGNWAVRAIPSGNIFAVGR